jgi:uncharacterized membrane protein YphA (DoxX/SURF4 family)
VISLAANVRSLFTALFLALYTTSFAFAQTARSNTNGGADANPAGDADFGLLIILGLIGLFILVAWLISRMGDDGGRGGDHTML